MKIVGILWSHNRRKYPYWLDDLRSRASQGFMWDVAMINALDDAEQIIETHGLKPYRELIGFPKRKKD